MMRRLFLFASAAFWLLVLAFATSQLWLPAAVETPQPVASGEFQALSEVARHKTPDDCWMAINDQVYDLSNYLPDHPSEPEVIVAWCGREASEAYRTKMKGRAHSARADRLLAAYRIATLTP
ncbi:MAG: cytochrome b5 domain-containing protein [Candidatus Accumulibacter sp.]|nr:MULTISPECIES: cytochrome b5 domain-containing protein [unclassified Candidatus Accumulibacter]MBL8368918.1 cytochrome b5 domain-containing protein [Accumulibacter sp.]MBN8515538.1 cytochrome b5 domain-containing protein [Accumulibacter sp.]HRE71643.1 cytochrome b5 domain-containing protein [Accumulibacter sp.]HRE86903.1 cytochrome b5 domain-containing protein [Accumulibacter sp.]HRI93256.1 cytochrome b5 domain-containing protein [Accumulibacter sp.]